MNASIKKEVSFAEECEGLDLLLGVGLLISLQKQKQSRPLKSSGKTTTTAKATCARPLGIKKTPKALHDRRRTDKLCLAPLAVSPKPVPSLVPPPSNAPVAWKFLPYRSRLPSSASGPLHQRNPASKDWNWVAFEPKCFQPAPRNAPPIPLQPLRRSERTKPAVNYHDLGTQTSIQL